LSDQAISEAERWFLKRGLPHFIDDYSPTRDVLTRAVPLLTLIFLVEVANAPKRDFPIWLDVVAVAVGFGILLGAWMVANRIRAGHRWRGRRASASSRSRCSCSRRRRSR